MLLEEVLYLKGRISYQLMLRRLPKRTNTRKLLSVMYFIIGKPVGEWSQWCLRSGQYYNKGFGKESWVLASIQSSSGQPLPFISTTVLSFHLFVPFMFPVSPVTFSLTPSLDQSLSAFNYSSSDTTGGGRNTVSHSNVVKHGV